MSAPEFNYRADCVMTVGQAGGCIPTACERCRNPHHSCDRGRALAAPSQPADHESLTLGQALEACGVHVREGDLAQMVALQKFAALMKSRPAEPVAQAKQANCGNCHKCASPHYLATTMIWCPDCGNKRCPKASDHSLACTGSNEPNQPGSVYGGVPSHPAAEQAAAEPMRISIDQSRDYLVEFMNKHFTDKTFRSYIRGEHVGRANLAGDFAWQMARALRMLEAARRPVRELTDAEILDANRENACPELPIICEADEDIIRYGRSLLSKAREGK